MQEQERDRNRRLRTAFGKLSAAERWLWRSVAVLAALLILSQLALRAPGIRERLSPAVRWEGTRYTPEQRP